MAINSQLTATHSLTSTSAHGKHVASVAVCSFGTSTRLIRRTLRQSDNRLEIALDESRLDERQAEVQPLGLLLTPRRLLLSVPVRSPRQRRTRVPLPGRWLLLVLLLLLLLLRVGVLVRALRGCGPGGGSRLSGRAPAGVVASCADAHRGQEGGPASSGLALAYGRLGRGGADGGTRGQTYMVSSARGHLLSRLARSCLGLPALVPSVVARLRTLCSQAERPCGQAHLLSAEEEDAPRRSPPKELTWHRRGGLKLSPSPPWPKFTRIVELVLTAPASHVGPRTVRTGRAASHRWPQGARPGQSAHPPTTLASAAPLQDGRLLAVVYAQLTHFPPLNRSI